jgi:hypothetical protein
MMKKILILAALACNSCEPNETPSIPSPETPAAQTSEPEASKPQTLIGVPLEKAQKIATAAAISHRVVEIDGESQPVTRDFRPDRLNFIVEKGVVKGVTNG